jgi:hypothetical protein
LRQRVKPLAKARKEVKVMSIKSFFQQISNLLSMLSPLDLQRNAIGVGDDFTADTEDKDVNLARRC